jgi:hypothetical protein
MLGISIGTPEFASSGTYSAMGGLSGTASWLGSTTLTGNARTGMDTAF